MVALQTWLKFARISIGPVFRRVVGGKVDAERLTDKHVARLVKHDRARRRRARRPDRAESGKGSSPGIRCAPASPPRPRSTSAMCRSNSATSPPK